MLAPTLVQPYSGELRPGVGDFSAVVSSLELRQSFLGERFCISESTLPPRNPRESPKVHPNLHRALPRRRKNPLIQRLRPVKITPLLRHHREVLQSTTCTILVAEAETQRPAFVGITLGLVQLIEYRRYEKEITEGEGPKLGRLVGLVQVKQVLLRLLDVSADLQKGLRATAIRSPISC